MLPTILIVPFLVLVTIPVTVKTSPSGSTSFEVIVERLLVIVTSSFVTTVSLLITTVSFRLITLIKLVAMLLFEAPSFTVTSITRVVVSTLSLLFWKLMFLIASW